jgi:hypothetical protein
MQGLHNATGAIGRERASVNATGFKMTRGVRRAIVFGVKPTAGAEYNGTAMAAVKSAVAFHGSRALSRCSGVFSRCSGLPACFSVAVVASGLPSLLVCVRHVAVVSLVLPVGR